MSKTVALALAGLFASAFAVIAAEPSTLDRVDGMNPATVQIAGHLAAFKETRDVDRLHDFGGLIRGLWLGEPKDIDDWQQMRRMKLVLWLDALNLADENIDPTFDPEDAPPINVDPRDPRVTPGTDPKAIQDPKLRAEHEELIRQNAAQAAAYGLQRKLLQFKEDWIHEISAYIKRSYTNTPEDRDEIEEALLGRLSNDLTALAIMERIFAEGSDHALEPRNMTKKLLQVARTLSAFRETPERDELYDLSRLIGRLWYSQPKDIDDWQRMRRMKLVLWLDALKLVNENMDPDFDPKDRPEPKLAPWSHTISSGADPKSIQDPKLRREYEELLRQNAALAAAYSLQRKLRQFKERWIREIPRYIERSYTNTPEDRDEIRRIFERHRPGDEAKALLEACLANLK